MLQVTRLNRATFQYCSTKVLKYVRFIFAIWNFFVPSEALFCFEIFDSQYLGFFYIENIFRTKVQAII